MADQKIEQSSHAFFAPSSAGRWWLGGCTGSTIIDVSEIPEPKKPAADHGTYLHGVAEKMLRENGPAPDALSPPDRRSVETYVDYVRSRPGLKRFEFRSELVPGLCGGTADAVIINGDHLEIVDYKSGSGYVDPVENPQEIIYAAGVIGKLGRLGYEFKTVELTIVQPALENLSSWRTTASDILERARLARDVIYDVVDGRVEFVASEDNCRFCRAVPICPAYDLKRAAAARDDFREYGVAAANEKLETWGARLRLVPFLEKWVKAVKEATKDMALAGAPVDGFKVVEGRKGSRDWTEKGKRKAVEFLAELGFKETDIFGEAPMVSPNQAEELLKDKVEDKTERADAKKTLSKFWSEGKPGAPTLVPESDSRPPIDKNKLAARDFADHLTKTDQED